MVPLTQMAPLPRAMTPRTFHFILNLCTGPFAVIICLHNNYLDQAAVRTKEVTPKLTKPSLTPSPSSMRKILKELANLAMAPTPRINWDETRFLFTVLNVTLPVRTSTKKQTKVIIRIIIDKFLVISRSPNLLGVDARHVTIHS